MTSPDHTMAAIVDTFLPAAEGLPSASQLGVHRRLLAEVDALGKPALRRQLDLLVRAMSTPLGTMALGGRPGRPTSLADMDQAAREAFMRRLGASSIGLKRTAFQDLKRLTLLLAYGIEDLPWRARTGFVPPVPDAASPSRITVRTPRAGETLAADVVVIGSGPGGGVTAAMLAESGKRVLVLERAAMVGEDGFGGPELDGLGALFLDRGLAATSDRWISIRAGSAVGGGSVINWASSLRAPDAVRDEWRAAGVGDDLDEHYAAIEADIGVTSDESPRNGPNDRLATGLDAMGLPWQVIPRNVRDCGDCGPCAVGCRRGAKQSVLRPVARGSVRSTGRRSWTARRSCASSWRAGGPAGSSPGFPGGEITVRAPMVALAGGLDPLQRSSSGPGSPAASPAGRCTSTPWSAVLGHLRRADGTLVRRPPERHVGRLRGRRRARGASASRPPRRTPASSRAGFPWIAQGTGSPWCSRTGSPPSWRSCGTEAPGAWTPDRDGTVTVRYAPGPQDRELLRLGALRAGAAPPSGRRGAHRAARDPAARVAAGAALRPLPRCAQGARRSPPTASCCSRPTRWSSCRIGLSPRTSVADPDGQVHGVRGLWVTDSSAMPSASGVNPMLSLMALAHRTATRMVDA